MYWIVTFEHSRTSPRVSMVKTSPQQQLCVTCLLIHAQHTATSLVYRLNFTIRTVVCDVLSRSSPVHCHIPRPCLKLRHNNCLCSFSTVTHLVPHPRSLFLKIQCLLTQASNLHANPRPYLRHTTSLRIAFSFKHSNNLLCSTTLTPPPQVKLRVLHPFLEAYLLDVSYNQTRASTVASAPTIKQLINNISSWHPVLHIRQSSLTANTRTSLQLDCTNPRSSHLTRRSFR